MWSGVMVILDVENVTLPNVNQKYGYSPTSRRLYLNKEYREFENVIITLMQRYARGVKVDPPYSISIHVKTYMDADNFLKPIIDSMSKAGIIGNDKDVLHYEVVKTPKKKGSGSCIKVEVSQWNK
jgi:Holliday junction resolvase RusA-like endonuclease